MPPMILARGMGLSRKTINNPSFLDDLGSIAPLDSEQKVPRMIRKFQRNYNEPTTSDDVDALAKTKPITSLPRALIPNKGSGLQPPLMHYGWIADEHKLWQYGLDHDLIVHQFCRMKKSDLTGDEDPNDVEPSDWDPENCVVKRMPSRRSTITRVLFHIMESVGIKLPLCDPLKVRISLEPEDVDLIVLYTNWHLRKAAKKDKVDAFARRMAELGMPLQGKPKWYLDFYDVYWTAPGEFDTYYI